MSYFNTNLQQGSSLKKTAYERNHLLYNKVISVLKLAHHPSAYKIVKYIILYIFRLFKDTYLHTQS